MVFNPSLQQTSNCQDSLARWPVASEFKLIRWDLGQLLIQPIRNHLCEHFANLVKKENAPVIVRFPFPSLVILNCSTNLIVYFSAWCNNTWKNLFSKKSKDIYFLDICKYIYLISAELSWQVFLLKPNETNNSPKNIKSVNRHTIILGYYAFFIKLVGNINKNWFFIIIWVKAGKSLKHSRGPLEEWFLQKHVGSFSKSDNYTVSVHGNFIQN